MCACLCELYTRVPVCVRVYACAFVRQRPYRIQGDVQGGVCSRTPPGCVMGRETGAMDFPSCGALRIMRTEDELGDPGKYLERVRKEKQPLLVIWRS